MVALVTAGVFAVPDVVAAAPPDPGSPAGGPTSVPVSPVNPVKSDPVEMPQWRPPVAAWPAGGTGVVAVDPSAAGAAKVGPSAAARAAGAAPGGLPVVARAPVDDPEAVDAVRPGVRVGGDTPASLRVRVLDRATTEAAGIDGALFTVERGDGRADSGVVALDVDYSGFAGMVGGDFALRLGLVEYPACVLITPGIPECSSHRPVAGAVNVTSAQVLSVDRLGVSGDTEQAPEVAGELTVLAVMAASSSPGGDYTKTSLAPSSSWAVGEQGADFSYTYPLQTPPSVGGPAPDLKLSYSSGSVDGRSLRENSQASWVGMGWQFDVGFIERQHRSCTDENMAYQDLCWFNDNATMSFGGRSVRLLNIPNTNRWYAQTDDGLKIENIFGAPNNSTRGEYWKVTDLDGVVYYFGRGYRGIEIDTKTWSAQRVPVYGNQALEPCNNAATGSMYDNRCYEVYRWNLDYVVDPRGNSMTYFYTPYNGSYGGMLGSHGDSKYTVNAMLARVEYGTRAGQEATTPAPAQVVFTPSWRCDPGTTGKPCQGNNELWPDTPWDLHCDVNAPVTGCNDYSPSFWTQYKLDSVQTQVRDATTGTYTPVDHYLFHYSYPPNGDHVAPFGTPENPKDDTTPALWLNKIRHTGQASGPGITGGQLIAPEIHFGGNKNTNRVSWGDNAGGAPPLMHWRLTQILHDTGSRTDVSYEPGNCSATAANPAYPSTEDNSMKCWPQYYNGSWVWFHKYLVDTVSETDLTGGGPAEVWDYDYSGASSNVAALWAYDTNEIVPASRRSWSQWRGYATVDTYHGPPAGPRQRTRALFYRGMNGDRGAAGTSRHATVTDSQGIPVVDSSFLAGTVRERSVIDGADIPTTTINNPIGTHLNGAFPNDAWRIRPHIVRTGTYLAHNNTRRWTTTENSYDDYGQPTVVKNYGDAAAGIQETCTATKYAYNTTNHLINVPYQVYTRAGAHCAQADPLLHDTRTFYDGTTTLGAAPTTGLPTRMETLVSTGPSVWAVTEVGYDVQGRPTSSKDARGQINTTTYTPASGGPLLQITTTNPLGHAIVATVNPGRGAPVTVTDPNGKSVAVRYDTLGRLVTVWLPGQATSGTPSVEYVYAHSNTAANVVTTKKIGPNGNQIVSYDLFDGRMRPRQAQQPAPRAFGGRIITDIKYDAYGQTAVGSTLYNSAEPAAALVQFNSVDVRGQSRYTYDLLGRVKTDELWSSNVKQWQTATSYDGDRAIVTPPVGGIPTTTIVDGLGRARELWQHLGPDTTSPHQTTSYTYDRLGSLTQLTDPAGNTWTSTYDIGGRVTATTDPDRGATEMTYTAAGDLATSKDARDIVLSYVYDDLGRKTELWQGAAGTGTKRASWEYDSVAGGVTAKGQLIRSTRWHNNEALSTETTSFDANYRPLSTKVSLPTSMDSLTGPWITATTYTPDGQVATQTLPAAGSLPAETITHTYDNAGYPLTMAGTDTYISNTAYTDRGDVTGLTLGVGTKRVRLDKAIDPATGRLTENRVSTENQTTPGAWVPQLVEQYGYDAAGNVKNINEVNSAGTTVSNQCFTYDTLRRLTEAWTTAAATCQATPTQTIVGGPDPYWTSYQHNAIGNRTQDTVHTAAGNTTRNYTYPTSGPTSVRPHAIATVTASGLNPGTDSYNYDNVGNTNTRNISGKPGQALTWDAEGHLASVTDSGGTTSYVYTPEGQRLLSDEPGAVTTLYLEGFELRRTTAGITCTRQYGVAVRTTNGGLTWTAADHHGTGQVAINPATLAVTRRKTDPYGNPRGPATGWPTTRGFVNGVNDPTGLVHLGAREYESTTGRFISVDPIMDVGDPGHWNGYAYANSNPATASDPDGLFPTCKKPDGEDCKHPAGGGGDPCAGGCGASTPYDTHAGDPSKNPYNGKMKDKLGELLLKDWQQDKYLEAIEAVDKHSSAKKGYAHLDFTAIVAKVEVNGELQVVVFATYSTPEDLIDELNAMGVTVYVAKRPAKQFDPAQNGHAEAVAKQWRFDMEASKTPVNVTGYVSSNSACSDICAKNMTYFSHRKDGTGPQLGGGSLGFEGDRVFTPEWVRNTRRDLRKQEKAGGLPKRGMSGINVALTWFRSPGYAGDPLAQGRLPQVRGGPGLGGPQEPHG